MRYKAVAIYTLAALAAGEFDRLAFASPDAANSGVRSPESNFVVPVQTPATQQAAATVTAPEVAAQPEFAQTSATFNTEYTANAPAQSTPAANTVPVITPSAQLAKAASGEVLPTPVTVAQTARSQSSSTLPNDLVVTAMNVRVTGVSDELQQIARETIRTRPGRPTNQQQLNGDVQALLNSGLFADARVSSTTNSSGVDVVYQVEPVVVRSLQLSGNRVLTQDVARDLFQTQLGKPISPGEMRQGIEKVEQWYEDNGYILARVLDARSTPDGVAVVEVTEGTVSDVNLRFLDEEGDPTDGRTQEDFIRSQLQLKPGDVFQVDVARQDLQQLYRSGLFDNVDIALNGDPNNLDVTYDLTERPARAVNAGGGYSDNTGLFGTISYQDQNLGGVNQKLGFNMQVSARDLQFEGNYTNPYRASNPDMPGYNVNAFRGRSISRTFDGDVDLANGDDPREGQFGAGITLSKPVNEWDATVGVNYTRTSIRDDNGNLSPTDELGNPLSFSGTGIDDLVTVSAGVRRDKRNNPVNPTQGSLLSFNTEQSVPLGNGSILMNRLEASYTQYAPINLLGSEEKPDVLAFNVQGGTTIGDLPPYEAFNLGGLNSVRGYGTGDVGSGRSYVLASAEYRIPVFNPVGAVLFADFASDLGSGDTVPGEPGVVRGKPGSGFGYGAGVRVNSPLGVIRADLGFNDQGDSRLQFGLGQRF